MLPMATALVRRGHTLTILIPPYDNPGDTGKIWVHEGVKLENAAVSGQQSAIRTQLSLARQLAQRTRVLKPDLIHIFKPIGPSALAMGLLQKSPILRQAQNAASSLQSPILVDNDDWEGAGGWLEVNPYPTLQKRVLAWQEQWALRHANAITVASHVLAERSRELNGTPNTPIMVFPNGPDASLRQQVAQAQTQRDTLRLQFGWADKHVVIYAGTVPHGHDMDMAVQAVRQNLRPGLRFVIVATGDGLPSLREAIEQAGIAQYVEWHSFMPHSQLIERLVAADVAIYPYRDSNINRAKCSGKVIDYMACAKPMVVSDVGMNRYYLEHKISGLLTPPGDAEAFTTALGQLLTHPQPAERMGQAAQQRVWQHFGWDERVIELESLYKKAITANQQAGTFYQK